MPDYNVDDPEFKAAQHAAGRGNGYLPPGGGGIGPGGGFGGSFGGLAFGAAQALPEFGAMRGKRKVVMGPNGPISVAYSPMVSDTVPAMLSPGEGILNNGAMAAPGMADFLQQANKVGMQRMAAGGVVPQGGEAEGGQEDMAGMGGGGDIRELLLALLPVLLGMQEPQGFGCGGMVKPERFAWGGVAGQRGGWSNTQMAPTTPRMPQAGLGGRGTAQRPGAQPLGFNNPGGVPGRGPTGVGAPPPPGGGSPPGVGTGGLSPWGDPALMPGSPNPGDEVMKRLWEQIKQFGQAGAFSPEGNQQLLQSLQGEATQNADALRHRASSLADMQGLDAGQRGSYAMQTDLNTQGGVANTLNSAKLGLLQNQQQLGQNLLGKAYDANTQAWLAQLAKWMQG